MATPFSPFVRRAPRDLIKKRQSFVSQDLIDWDAPVMPEIERQRIVYEDQIKELTEDHEIETLITEQIYLVTHETILNEYKTQLKSLEDTTTQERTRSNFLLNQVKTFEENLKESNQRIDELEAENTQQKEQLEQFEQEKENWSEERVNLQNEIENLNFRNNETTCELQNHIELFLQKKHEVEDMRKKFDGVRNQLNYYKRLAKNKMNDDDE